MGKTLERLGKIILSKKYLQRLSVIKLDGHWRVIIERDMRFKR